MLLDEVLILADQTHDHVGELDAGIGLGVREPIVDALCALLEAVNVETLLDLDFPIEDVGGVLKQQDRHREERAETADEHVRVVPFEEW